MSDPDRPNHEPDLGPAEQEGLAELGQRLRDSRPIPHPAFRGMVRQQLLADAGSWRERPQRLRRLVAIYACAGVALLTFAGAGVLGVGPLAPEEQPEPAAKAVGSGPST